MNPKHKSWTSIVQFHNVLRNYTLQEIANNLTNVNAKIKLHGTNASICFVDGNVFSLHSRNQKVDGGDDGHFGFVSFMSQIRDNLSVTVKDKIVRVYGEWAGPGVQKKVSVSLIKEKSFFIYAALISDLSDSETGVKIVYEPSDLLSLFESLPDRFYVLPWFYEKDIFLNFSNLDHVNEFCRMSEEDVEKIDKEDPYVKDMFGISGTGEGLVFYPKGIEDYSRVSEMMFKVKGPSHKITEKTIKPSLNPKDYQETNSFIREFLTEERCRQGMFELGIERIPKNTSKFIEWIADDIIKESADERSLSEIPEKVIRKEICTAAAKWFLGK